MRYWLIFILVLLFAACESDNGGKGGKTPPPPPKPVVQVPDFSGDSAFVYVERQLAFGPRVPNSKAHEACAKWMVKQFKEFGAQVQVQKATVDGRDLQGNAIKLPMKNIIATYNPEAKKRIMLTAHWDTRPYGDAGEEARKFEPIPGANDGGSGVAVLLEAARHFGQQNPRVGVDIILWDVEDYGNPGIENTYCLGSQYWAQNPHKPNYRAVFGINLDMVGAAAPTFKQDYYSMQFAGNIVTKVWNTAAELGYGNLFPQVPGASFIDDHYYINVLKSIPTIDICDQAGDGGRTFFGQWHTHQDDIHIISKETLKAVGQTVLTVAYRE
jgi:Zn-dependent M28 family amino/carboxypeptidase